MPKEKLSKIPTPRRQKPGVKAPAGEASPDLSHIAEGLRLLAVPCAELVFDPANARTHGEANLAGIAGSLAVYGQVKPVVVRKDNRVVVAGNGTLQAALSLGWTHLAAVFVEMDAATAAGFSIADNRSAELAGWDKAALDALLREVSTGNDERLDAMLAELAAQEGLYLTESPKEPEAPEEFASYDEGIKTDYCCPKCGYQWSGNPNANAEANVALEDSGASD